MKINKAYKVELKPNNRQKALLIKSIGIARFAYNWGLNQRIKLYECEKKSLSAFDQQKILSSIKKKQFPWMLEISKFAPQYALENLETSFKNFFRGLKTGQKIGFPKFKSKHESRQSFRFSFTFNITESTIHIPKIGRVRLKEKGYVPTENVHYNSVTVSKEFGRWFASVQCEVEVPDLKKPETVLGVDLGIKTLLTCSNGQVFENNKYFKKENKNKIHNN